MNNFIFIATLIGIVVPFIDGALSNEQEKLLLDLHNKYRRDVAQGQVTGQPPASNMMELKWSNEAESKAQSYVDKCIYDHDKPADRKYGSFDWVGQNLARTLGYTNITRGVTLWFNEHQYYNFTTQHCSKNPCGHYTQLVWAETTEVGCGLANCNERIMLICNYARGGNINKGRPYEVGQACTKCPSGTKCNKGLCFQ